MLTKRARRWLIAGTTAAAFLTSASVATTLIVLDSHPAAVTMRPVAAASPASPKPSAKPSRPAPVPTKTVPAPTPTRTVYVTPPPAQSPPASAPAPAPSSSAPAQPQLTNGVAVVLQYYQDITDHDWPAAWALGGNNIAAQNGQTYDSWMSGYTTTTASISVISYGTWGDGTVWTDLSATQLDGSVKTYSGTYSVQDGVLVSAHITQTS
jgi:hypothetical protein